MNQSHGFTRHGEELFVAQFSDSEKEVLINLSQQIIELLAERVDHHNEDPLAAMVGITVHDTPPEDEVLLRLLPNAYADPEAASDFRRYTEPQLRGSKQRNLRLVREQLTVLVDENHGGVIEELDAEIAELEEAKSFGTVFEKKKLKQRYEDLIAKLTLLSPPIPLD